jgi:hypothetical protein
MRCVRGLELLILRGGGTRRLLAGALLKQITQALGDGPGDWRAALGANPVPGEAAKVVITIQAKRILRDEGASL